MRTPVMEKILHPLCSRQPLQSLTPKAVWNRELEEEIRNATVEQLTGRSSVEEEDGRALKSGLHLWNDSLDVSHSLSQQVHNRTGSYWHAIMHRMEPDYSNSKYWFRQVGSHPVYELLREKAAQALPALAEREGTSPLADQVALISKWEAWDPYAVVDLAEKAAKGPG